MASVGFLIWSSFTTFDINFIRYLFTSANLSIQQHLGSDWKSHKSKDIIGSNERNRPDVLTVHCNRIRFGNLTINKLGINLTIVPERYNRLSLVNMSVVVNVLDTLPDLVQLARTTWLTALFSQ